MNTDNSRPPSNPSSAISREVVKALDESSIHMPIDQMLQELQLIVERLTFGMNTGQSGTQPALNTGDIGTLLGTDVSPALTTFVLWLNSRNMLRLLSGKNGRHFLSFCVQHYSSVKEIRCSVPISLSEGMRQSLLGHLRRLYPEPARIIFEVAPSLVAGCVIHDGESVTDMSLAGRLPELVGAYIAAARPTVGASNGS